MNVRRRLSLLLAAIAAAVAAPAGPLSAPGAGGAPGSAFAARLAAPGGGDVSYGVAEVRIMPGVSLTVPRAAQVGQRIFTQRVGGLTIVARSTAWNRLRPSTRVYVVVARVGGADATLREVAFFVVRRRTGNRRSSGGGEVVVSIGNARPALGSFWVRGADGRGFATIFAVRDMLATALRNWSRYLGVLRVAHALVAASHPLELAPGPPDPVRQASRRRRERALWTGGQRPSARVRAIFRLLADAVSDPLQYAQAKRNPLITSFITHELNNPGLARRWRAVTTVLPLHVPDHYAAAAGEESLFTHVTRPRITHAQVAMADGPNSAVEFQKGLAASASTLTVEESGCDSCIPGRVTGRTYVYGQNIDCPPPDPSAPCTASFLTGQTWETLAATAAPGWELSQWHGCDQIIAGDCRVLVGVADRTVNAEFHLLRGALIVQVVTDAPAGGPGPGTVTVQPGGESCQATCVWQFSYGDHLTLTATPNPGASFAGWGGNPKVHDCESTSGNICQTTIPPGLQDYITASFDAPAVSLTKSGTGTGTVTSSPPGIDCGPSCPAQDGFFATSGEQVTLTATPAPGSSFTGWTGCDSTADNACITTATLDPSHDVTAEFTAAAALTMVRIAGIGTACVDAPACGEGGAATSAQLSFPSGLAVDAAGNIYIADTSDQEIRKVAAGGTITRIAGTGATCSSATCGDGGPATSAQLDNPQSVAVDASGDLYIADTDDQEVRKISPGGTITTIAGIHGDSCSHPPDCGDGGSATHAQLSQPLGVAVDAQGSVYIADGGDNEIRKVAPNGTITRIAGTGAPCTTAPSCGDGGPARNARLSTPASVAVDSSGDVYIADSADNEIRKIAADGTITRIAGTGDPCQTEPLCTNGPMATQAELSIPMGVATDTNGEVFVADTGDNVVWAVDSFGQISQVAGTGIRCTTAPSCGDGGPAAAAQLNDPEGISLDSSGNLDIADTQDHEIRQAQVRRPL